MQTKKLSNGILEVLTWYAGDQLYGLYLEDCKEVIKNIEIVTIPNSKKYLAGVHNLRGEIITVIDVGVKLGYPQKPHEKGKAVIRLKAKSKVSLLADRIHDILEIPSDALEPPPSNLSEKELNCISSAAKSKDGVVLIINLEGLTAIE